MSMHDDPIKAILVMKKDKWDHDGTPPVVRNNFRKVLDCGTPAMGGTVYASDSEQYIGRDTCKSRQCISCGCRGTLDWQRYWWRNLPDIPYAGITFTMPNQFWPIFKAHPKLRHDLPAIGAAAISQWAWERYQVRLLIIVVQQTFGKRLNFNPHLHIIVSLGGLRWISGSWQPLIQFNNDEIRELWCFAVTEYLEEAFHNGLLHPKSLPPDFLGVIHQQRERIWNIHISGPKSKMHLIGYAGRYIRRPPISRRRILSVTEDEVVFLKKATGSETCRIIPEQFVECLASHVPGHYIHSMTYHGLLAPRSIQTMRRVVFAAIGQPVPPRAERLPWAAAIKKYFGVDPLLDSKGNRMHKVGRIKPSGDPSGSS
jgi:hypothetical protein